MAVCSVCLVLLLCGCKFTSEGFVLAISDACYTHYCIKHKISQCTLHLKNKYEL